MAKTLSARQTELAARAGRRAVKLVTVTTYSDKGAGTVDTVWRFSDRTVWYDYGNTGTNREFEPFLIRVPDPVVQVMPHLPPEREDASDRGVSLVLSNRTRLATGKHLIEDLRADNLEGAVVEIAELFADVPAREGHYDFRGLTGAEHVVLMRGVVDHVANVTREEIVLAVRQIEPEIPWKAMADAANNHPEDIGKRKAILIGAFDQEPCLGITVGWKTTLVTKLSADGIGDFDVTDTAGFPGGAFAVRIGGEEIEVTKVDGDTLNIASGKRAQNGTLAAEHLAGMPVVEIISSAKWSVAGHQCKAVSTVYAENVYADELFKIPASLYSVNLNDSGETTITITAANMRTLLAAMQSSANAYTSASVSDELPVAGQANIIDGNTGTAYNLSSGSDPADATTDVTFAAPPGEITYQETIVNVAAFGGGGDGVIDVYFDGIYHASIAEATSGAQTYGTLYGVHVVTLSMDPAAPSRAIYDVRRNYDYKDGSTVEVSGAEVGYDLALYASGEGVAAPDGTNYSVGSGALLEHPSDVLRWLLAVHCGLGHGAVDDASFDAAVSRFSAQKLRGNLARLGDSFYPIARRIAFESALNMTQEEGASGVVWKLHGPSYDATNDNFEFSTTGAVAIQAGEWESIEEVGRDLAQLFTRFLVVYDHDPFLGSGPDAFRKIYRADKDQNDISARIPTSLFTAAEARYGRREHAGFALYLVADDDTASWFLGYMAQELMRAARVFRLTGVPAWRVYDRERGDFVTVPVPWISTGSLPLRITRTATPLGVSRIDLDAVEVLTA